MKNADMPAMPVLNGDNEPAEFDHSFYRNGNLAVGLTKREVMAMHAPEMPDWFGEEWSMKFAGEDRYFKSDVDEYGCAVREKTRVGRSAMYFAWRAHYADAMLAELEKQHDQ
ncbi:hypothetical protein [Aeromonas caviae]|uniref:hypothetical protein n=1 Tax=Aeromonas caviae TaxID=648 RepID=UPI00311E56EF